MKKIALLGDSIRLLGYGKKVPALLGGDFEVVQPEDNCRFAQYTMRIVQYELSEMLDGCDVIHWNNGLWDTFDYADGEAFTPLEQYLSALSRIADVLLAKSRTVIFATTTPTSEKHIGQYIERIREYNAAAVSLLEAKGVVINDLFTPVAEDIDRYICDDLIHLSEDGVELCAALVAQKIKSVL